MHNVVWGCAEILPIFLLYDKTEFKHTQPNVSIKKNLKYWKAPKLLRKTYFKRKFRNQEGVIISDLGESSRGIFAASAHVEARFSCYCHILVTSRNLQNSNCLPSLEKSKAEESPCKKKKRKKEKAGPKKKERVPFCQEKKKNPVWKWPVQASGAPRWRPDFEQKKSPSNQNLPYMMLKTRFPFLYASTSLDTKTLTIALNFNFESYTTIRCLAPQHVLRFFHFWRGFFLSLWNFAHYCVFLLNAPLSDRDEKKKTSLQWVTYPQTWIIWCVRY